ncbi:MAG: 16S rRNA (uracil(1498)-N(3))-methyltransferase [Magnetococcales bacterium]|nr:16S rRNA (uracil(1498)-N(3))-methyltransferase [Magnetococcales bacterium]
MIPRLLVATPLHPDLPVTLNREEERYLLKVLRLDAGAPVVLLDGTGGEWPGEVAAVRPRVLIHLSGHRPVARESPLAITLVAGLARSAPMEWVIQKAVELGVATVVPLVTRRSVSRPDARQAANKLERWQRIAREAVEQCGRTRLPLIHPPVAWPELPPLLPGGPRLLFWEEARENGGLGRLPAPGPTLTLLTGPEGGLDPAEVAAARDGLGFVTVGLGPRILRAETAAITVLAMAQTLWGDLA